jgi:hypothetical protein
MRIHCLIFLMVASLLILAACNDEETDVENFLVFERDQQRTNYAFHDSTFMECYPPGFLDLYYHYSINVYENGNAEFPYAAISFFNEMQTCEVTELPENTRWKLTLTKRNEQGEYIDFVGYDNFFTSAKQSKTDRSIVVKGTFTGWLYQWYPKRVDPTAPPREPTLIDSIYVKNGGFQFSTGILE